MILIEMDYVIDLCELADYLGLDVISKECSRYFEDNFTIEHLPIIIPQVTATSKCISSGALNAFICRNFLKIKNLYADSIDNSKKTFWLEYPIEIIEYICALDLMIYSEYQVFDAIMKWIAFKDFSRKCHLAGLLKLVRWCHLTDEDLSRIKENGLFKSSGFEPIFCYPRKVDCVCTFNRTKQNFVVMIDSFEGSSDLRINVLDNNLIQLFSKVIKYDDKITKEIFHDEAIFDITYDAGSMIGAFRIDWKRNKYTYVQSDLSFNILQRCVIRNKEDDQPLYVNVGAMWEAIVKDGYLILEAAEAFIMITFERGYLNYFSRPLNTDRTRWHIFDSSAILLYNAIYLFNNFALYEFKIQDNVLMQTWSHRLCCNEFSFEDTLLTSSPAGDKIMVINKYTRNYICFDVNTKQSSTGQIISYSSTPDQKESNGLRTLTQAFLPLNAIRTCLNTESNSEN
uniref:BACK domain-containing protein n=1 Tax=Tetranychus urticae TaxID=32264 RepID=T1JYD7_TETUR